MAKGEGTGKEGEYHGFGLPAGLGPQPGVFDVIQGKVKHLADNGPRNQLQQRWLSGGRETWLQAYRLWPAAAESRPWAPVRQPLRGAGT